MAKIDPKILKDTVVNYIKSFKSVSDPSVEIQSVTRQENKITVEGQYIPGLFDDERPFKMIFDDELNPVEINLKENVVKKS